MKTHHRTLKANILDLKKQNSLNIRMIRIKALIHRFSQNLDPISRVNKLLKIKNHSKMSITSKFLTQTSHLCTKTRRNLKYNRMDHKSRYLGMLTPTSKRQIKCKIMSIRH